MATIKRPGATIYYEVWGDGEPSILLLGGHTRSISDLKGLGKKLVGAGYSVVAIDHRASGMSIATRAFSVSEMVEDVCAVAAKVCSRPFLMVGISMGGMIAQLVHANLPADHVLGMVLVSTARSFDSLALTAEPWPQELDAIYEKLANYFDEGFVARNKLLIKAMAKNTLKSIESGEFQQNALWQRQAMTDYRGSQTSDQLSVPVIIIHGEQDKIIPPKHAAKLSSAYLNAHEIMLPGIGHLIIAEAPEEFYQRVVEFAKALGC